MIEAFLLLGGLVLWIVTGLFAIWLIDRAIDAVDGPSNEPWTYLELRAAVILWPIFLLGGGVVVMYRLHKTKDRREPWLRQMFKKMGFKIKDPG